jgi:hypothetical protein
MPLIRSYCTAFARFLFRLLPNPENEPDFYSMTPCYENPKDSKQDNENTALTVATIKQSSPEVVPLSPIKTDGEESSSSPKLSKTLDETLVEIVDSSAGLTRMSQTSPPSYCGARLDNILGSRHFYDIATARQYDSPNDNTTSLHDIGETILGPNSLLLHPYFGTYRVHQLPQQQRSHFLYPVVQRNFRPSLDVAAAILPLSQHDLQMQELFSQALLNRREDVVAEVALRSEIDVLNQAQRNLLVQQHQLLNLMEQAHKEPSASYLLQVAKAYRQLM